VKSFIPCGPSFPRQIFEAVKEKLLCVIAITDRVVHVFVEEGSGADGI
jgi:hypothetical protein